MLGYTHIACLFPFVSEIPAKLFKNYKLNKGNFIWLPVFFLISQYHVLAVSFVLYTDDVLLEDEVAIRLCNSNSKYFIKLFLSGSLRRELWMVHKIFLKFSPVNL